VSAGVGVVVVAANRAVSAGVGVVAEQPELVWLLMIWQLEPELVWLP
jgi:hypothetical protein